MSVVYRSFSCTAEYFWEQQSDSTQPWQ